MKKQDGFVSVIVAMIIMLFVTLIALGFAFLANQNQQQNQNRVLNTQAFYAAESGVNDAVDYLTTTLANTGTLPGNKTDCNTNLGAGYAGTIGSINTEVKYTCLLYDTAPNSLEYNVSVNDSKIVRVQSQSGASLKTISISWQDDQGSKAFASNNQHQLPQTSLWGGGTGDNLALNTGILRTTLIPVFGSITRADLTNKSQTLFLYPKSGVANTFGGQPFLATNGISDAAQGTFVDGHCASVGQNLPKYCNATITNLDNLGGTSTFFLRLRGLYRSASVTISATDANGPAKLINEQAVIDSTGKASNVLRRIQVRVPLTLATDRPEHAIETVDSLCKRLQVWPGGSSIAPIPGLATLPDTCKAN